jgi:hypothetical protein
MRNDSSLYSGISSNTAAKAERAKIAREERKRVKTDKKTILTPVAEIVVEELDKEKKATELKLLSMIQVGTTDEQSKDVIAALNLYSESINKLRSRLSNIMRTKA